MQTLWGLPMTSCSSTSESITRAPRRSPWGIAVYLTVAFIVAWAVWVTCAVMTHDGTPADSLVAVVIAGSFAPFIASGLARWRENGVRAALAFYRRGLQWRMGWPVLAVSVFALPLLGVAIAGASAASSGGTLVFQLGWRDIPYAYVWLLILGGPVAEEFGWSYLSDRLDERLAPFSSTLTLGVIWALWHLPLFFLAVPGLDQTFIPYGIFVVVAVSVRFLMAWCYHRGGRNILSNLLAHNGMNFALSLVPIVLPVRGQMQWRFLAFGALAALCAAALYRLVPVGRDSKPSPHERPEPADASTM